MSVFTYLPTVGGHTKLHKNAVRGNLTRLNKNISDGINVYTQTDDWGETPLGVAIGNKQTAAAHILLDIYASDLKFIEDSIVSGNKDDAKCWRSKPILIGFGDDDIKSVQNLYESYKTMEFSDETDVKECTVVLLKRDNFTPVQVLWLSPKTANGKLIAIQIINRVSQNGWLYLNARIPGGHLFISVALTRELFTIMAKLIELGAEHKPSVLFVAAFHSGQLETIQKIYEVYDIKIGEVLKEYELFTQFGDTKYEILMFVFEKYLEQDCEITWEKIVNLQFSFYQKSVFHTAITNQQLEFAEHCLQYNPDMTGLNLFDLRNEKQVCRLLMKMIDIDDTLLDVKMDNLPIIALLMVRNNYIDGVKQLFTKYPNAKNTYYASCNLVMNIIEIITRKMDEMVELLIIQGRDYFDTEMVITIIGTAAQYGLIDIMKTIFEIFRSNLTKSTKNIEIPLITALQHKHLNIYKFLASQIKYDLKSIRYVDGRNLLGFAMEQNQPRYDENMPDSLGDSRIPDDSEDEEDQRLGLLPEFKRPDENLGNPYEITDHDRIENENMNRIFDQLIDFGLDFDHKCLHNSNLLHYSVRANNFYTTQKLLKLGVSLNQHNDDGDLPIHYATNLEMFELLNTWTALSYVNSKNSVNWKTPLHTSVLLSPKHIGLARYILEHGGDINAIDEYGRTPIHYVYDIEYAELLLEHGANINVADKNGDTPIHSAFERFSPKTLQLFFEQKNVDYCAVNNNGTSYLFYFVNICSVHDGPTKLYPNICTLDNTKFKLLLQTHCNDGKQHGTSILNQAISFDEKLTVMLLQQPSIDVLARDEHNGNSALHIAVLHGQYNIISLLVEKGVPIDILNNDNNTPLNLLLQYECRLIEAIIMQYRPNVNIRNTSGMTPILNAAITRKNLKIICELLQAGGNILDTDLDGNTAFSRLSDEFKNIFAFIV